MEIVSLNWPSVSAGCRAKKLQFLEQGKPLVVYFTGSLNIFYASFFCYCERVNIYFIRYTLTFSCFPINMFMIIIHQRGASVEPPDMQLLRKNWFFESENIFTVRLKAVFRIKCLSERVCCVWLVFCVLLSKAVFPATRRGHSLGPLDWWRFPPGGRALFALKSPVPYAVFMDEPNKIYE